jgi:hypothetical protein
MRVYLNTILATALLSFVCGCGKQSVNNSSSPSQPPQASANQPPGNTSPSPDQPPQTTSNSGPESWHSITTFRDGYNNSYTVTYDINDGIIRTASSETDVAGATTSLPISEIATVSITPLVHERGGPVHHYRVNANYPSSGSSPDDLDKGCYYFTDLNSAEDFVKILVEWNPHMLDSGIQPENAFDARGF